MKSSTSSSKITAEIVALALDPDARPSGDGYACRCPVHDDKTASLWVFDREGVTGVGFYCHAGCDALDVYRECQGRGIKTGSEAASKEPVINKLYVYYYYDGGFTTAVKERWARPDGGKLLDRHPKATWGRYLMVNGDLKKAEARKPSLDYDVLYGGDRLGDASDVLVVEGEKDCETARNEFFACVGLPQAKGFAWSRETEGLLRGRVLYLVPDNDGTGHRCMERFGLEAVGRGLDVRWIDLPRLKVKEDLTDWFALRDGSQTELRGLMAAAEPCTDRDLGWRGRIEYTDSGKIASTYQNVWTLLEHAAAFRGRLSYDDFLQAVLWDGEAVPEGLPAYLGTLLYDESGWSASGDGQVRTAMNGLAEQNRFDSLRDHVEALPTWDGVERLDGWLGTYCNAVGDFARVAGRKFLIGMIARAVDPGCKFDTALILEGEQAAGKSTVCSILGGGFYMDNLPDLTNKTRTSEEIQGKWLVEDAEMESASKSEVKRLKAFLSTRKDRMRPAYARVAIDAPRRCVVVVTTNREDYLVDETGDRRFWPVRCERPFDFAGLERDRDQLLAEAYAAYLFGEETYLRGSDADLQRGVAKTRFDLEHSDVADFTDWFLTHMPNGRRGQGTLRKEPLNIVNPSAMIRALRECGRLPAGSSDRVLANEVRRLLKHRGWATHTFKKEGKVTRAWALPGASIKNGRHFLD